MLDNLLDKRLRKGARTLVSDLSRDAARYAGLGGWYANAGFWATLSYRVGRFARDLPRGPMRLAIRAPQELTDKACRAFFNVHINPDARIGPGLCLIHPWNVMIGPGDVGENLLVFHEVTIGSNDNTPHTFPTIGKNVHVYAGAKVLGRIHVGDGANIGANCVVTSSVPAGATVVTAPLRVIPAAVVAAFGVRKADTGDLVRPQATAEAVARQPASPPSTMSV